MLAAEGLEGLVLRYGFFYGPGTSYASDGYQASEVRKRRFPIVGGGDGVFSFIQVEDAAAATVGRGRAGGARDLQRHRRRARPGPRLDARVRRGGRR